MQKSINELLLKAIMSKKKNVVVVIHDGHGHYASPDDWCSTDGFESLVRFNNMISKTNTYMKFSNAVSPAASTIMSIESILSGIYAAKAHKIHWRQWPRWDKFNNMSLGQFLECEKGYQVNGFSYLLNSENWMPSIKCYRPDLYKNFPSEKRDTHSQEAVISALRHYFSNSFDSSLSQCLFIHSVHVYEFWDEMNELLLSNGLTDKNTILALTADHYFPEGYGRLLTCMQQSGLTPPHHTDLTEFNTRVPFYLRSPGVLAGDVNALVSGYDLVPTVLDLLGFLSDWKVNFDGRSLTSFLKNKADMSAEQSVDRVVRCDNLYPYQIGEKQGRITAVRNYRYKLVIKPDPVSSYVNYRMSERWNMVVENREFYDLVSDPAERINLISTSLTDVELENLNLLDRFYHTSSKEIMSYHEISLRDEFKYLERFQKLSGSVLIVQTTYWEVFQTILNVFINEFYGRLTIDVMLADGRIADSKGINKLVKKNSEKSILDDLVLNDLSSYSSIIFCSHVNKSWFGNSYTKPSIWHPSFECARKLKKLLPEVEILYLGLDLQHGYLLDFFKNSLICKLKEIHQRMKLLLIKVVRFIMKPRNTSGQSKFIEKLVKIRQG